MASGNTLLVLTPRSYEPPATNYALFNRRNARPVLDFDPTTDWAAMWTAIMPRHYSGGGVTVTLIWVPASATSNACGWQVCFERIQTGDNVDSDSFAAVQSTSVSVSSATAPIYTPIAFTDGAQMDSVVAGDLFRLKVNRDADGSAVTDSMTGNAELLGIEIKET